MYLNQMNGYGTDMTDVMLSRFVAARRRYIEAQFQNLNSMQREAVLTKDNSI